MAERTYQEGLVDGKIEALEAMVAQHTNRMDNHSTRLQLLERSLWLTLGVVTAIEFLPKVMFLLNGQ